MWFLQESTKFLVNIIAFVVVHFPPPAFCDSVCFVKIFARSAVDLGVR